MPIDPSIPLSVQPPRFNNPFEVLGQYQQLRQQAEELRLRQQQAQSLEEERRQKIEKEQREQSQIEQINKLMQTSLTQNQDGVWVIDRAKFEPAIIQAGLGNRLPEYNEQLSRMDQRAFEAQKAHRNALAELGYSIALGDHDPGTVSLAVAPYLKNGLVRTDEVQPYLDAIQRDPNIIPNISEQLMALDPSVADRWQKRMAGLSSQQKTEAETNKLKMEMAGTLPNQHPTALQQKAVMLKGERRLVNYNPETGRSFLPSGEDVSDQIRDIPPAASGQQTATVSEAAQIADAIQAGQQPPDLKGLYRFAGPVRAELAKRGYDLAKASLDWGATQRHMQTLNGQQQTRLRQAVSTASESLDVIENLADQWNGGQFPALNKANLAAAKQGLYGKEAASIATQLEGQITDVVSELGQVYMGGNSPTDHALQLAEKNLRADWSDKVLRDMVTLARTNLTIRRNSMDTIGPAGTSATNPYGPQAAPSSGRATGAATTTYVEMTDPSGKKYRVPAESVAAAKAKGWK